MKKTVAILYICTGKYVAFWEEFYKSFEEKFLENYQKEYYVFTDSAEIYGEKENSFIHRIFQENLGWPGNTLFRFQMFQSVIPQLRQAEYIFFMNANVVCLKKVTGEMILPGEKELVVVQHPGYFNKQLYEYDYENRKESKACIPFGEGTVYVCGGINGGKSDSYIELIETLAKNIEDDYKRGIIAKWHDESHLNRYIWKREDYRLLSPAFCYPEDWKLPYEPVLMVTEKSKKIQLAREKEAEQKRKDTIAGKIYSRVEHLRRRVLYEIKKRSRS